MDLPSADPIEIIRHRASTEARLVALLEEAKSTATLDQVKAVIYDEGPVITFDIYVRMTLEQFTKPNGTLDIDTLLPVIQDAWNYFPHRSLNGQCPAELIAAKNQPSAHGTIDIDKIDEVVLALLLLGQHDEDRVWKDHDWEILDRLHEKGYISNPATKAKSVVLSDEGLREAERLFNKLFKRKSSSR